MNTSGQPKNTKNYIVHSVKNQVILTKMNKPPNSIPFDSDAEQAVIGSVLTEPECLDAVAEIVNENDFYDLRHGEIFKSFSKLSEKGEPIDLMTVASSLKRSDSLDKVGGSAYLAECINIVPSSAHAEHYAKIVKEKKILRELISTSNKAISAANGDADINELTDEIAQDFLNLTITTKKREKNVSDIIGATFSRIQEIAGGGITPGLMTGIKSIDDITGGLHSSDVIIIGARPSVGKTSLAISIARNVALRGGSVAFFSLEMSNEQLTEKILSIDSKVGLWKLRNGKINFKDAEDLKNSVERLKDINIILDDSPSPTIVEIRRACRRLRAKHKIGLIVIDYLQLVRPAKSTNNPVQDLTEISRGLKLIAKEMGVPLIALSQLSRNIEGRENKDIQLSDLRGTGAIEQDADLVIGLQVGSHQEQLDKTSTTDDIMMKLEILKHRNGPTGTAEAIFHKETTEFVSI